MTVILLRQHCCPRALDIISAAAEHSSQRRGWNGVLYWKRWEWWMMKVAGEQHRHHFHTLLPQDKCTVWAFQACMMESSNSQSLVDRILNWHFFALITPHKSEFEEQFFLMLLIKFYGATWRRTFYDILVLWRSLKPVFKIFAGFHFLYLRDFACTCVFLPTISMWNSRTLCSYAKICQATVAQVLPSWPVRPWLAGALRCTTMPRRFTADYIWLYHTSKNRFSNHHDTKPCTFADGCLMPVGGQKTAMTPARLADWFPMGPMMCHSSIQVLFVLMIWVLQR